MGSKVLKIVTNEVTEIESTWKHVTQQLNLLLILDERNPKPIDRAGRIGEEIRLLFRRLIEYKKVKEQND